jgi:hypothetical protein
MILQQADDDRHSRDRDCRHTDVEDVVVCLVEKRSWNGEESQGMDQHEASADKPGPCSSMVPDTL